MNVFISVLYAEGFWVRAPVAKQLGAILFKFLRRYQKCCAESIKRGVNRFTLTPKSHMIAHTAEALVSEAARAEWALNPLATANQMQEDFVGKPSRLSRRVHQKRIHTRVMERCMLNVWQSLFA